MNVFNFINKRCFSKVPELDLLALKTSKLNQWKLSEPELYVKNLSNHYGCVNAIEFSQNGNIIVSGGDDKRVLVWNLDTCLRDVKPQTHQMNEKHESNIFCVAIANGTNNIYSAGNDCCLIKHDIISGKCASFYKYEDVIYCLSMQPDNSNVVACACENNRVIIRDVRDGNHFNTVAIELITDIFPMHGVDFNPLDTQYIATANSFAGTQLWDVRYPKKWIWKYESIAHDFEYESNLSDLSNKGSWEIYEKGEDRRKLSSMSVMFDNVGRNLLVLRRRGYPILYNTEQCKPKHIFIDSKEKSYNNLASIELPNYGLKGYFNSCTMKSGSFAGCKSEFVVSGSDDFRIYMWKIPEESEELFVDNVHTTLSGHHSIPNEVRFDVNSMCLISSGVEKVIKMWSGLPLHPHIEKINTSKRNLNIQDYLNVMLSDPIMSMGDNNGEETIQEDVGMITFFDSLIAQDQSRHRDRKHDRAYFDIYEEYDPMDSESDNSSSNFSPNHFMSMFNYLPLSSSESTSRNSSTYGSPTSSFDPELDNDDSSSHSSNPKSLENLDLIKTHLPNTFFGDEVKSNLLLNCDVNMKPNINENDRNNSGIQKINVNTNVSAVSIMQSDIFEHEILTAHSKCNVQQYCNEDNVFNIFENKVIYNTSETNNDCILYEKNQLVIDNKYIPSINNNQQMSIQASKLPSIQNDINCLSPNKFKKLNFNRNLVNDVNLYDSIDFSNIPAKINIPNYSNSEIKKDSFVSQFINEKDESVVDNFTGIIFKKITNKHRQYRN